jgi:glycosyltransferase involved in cell wall biosynthesis
MEIECKNYSMDDFDVAVLIPCFNEEATVGDVVRGFSEALPTALIYVCDNNSTDMTADIARQAGAEVIFEPKVGKANAVRRLFEFVYADVYVLCDGDTTYDVSKTENLIAELINEKIAMIVGARSTQVGQQPYRFGHGAGNYLFTKTLKLFFGGTLTDVLSGYRVFSRPFVKSLPILSKGFDIEIEMTAHALSLGLPVKECQINYSERPKGSSSKLHTLRDGFRIAQTLLRLIIDSKPLQVLLFAALLQFCAAILLFWPVFFEYVSTGLVERLPTAILSLGLVLTGLFTAFSGIVLDSISRQRLEVKKIAYLNIGNC